MENIDHKFHKTSSKLMKKHVKIKKLDQKLYKKSKILIKKHLIF